MSEYPKISIITVVFNAEKYLEAAMQSLFAQNYPNLEYIVIDGGSTDGTLKIIEKHRDKIDYFISEKDRGTNDGTNKGFLRATGDFIGNLNADDLFEDGLLFKIADMIQKHPDSDIISCGVQIVRQKENGHLEVVKRFVGDALRFDLDAILHCPVSNARFFRHTLIEKYGGYNAVNEKNEYIVSSDKEFFVRFALIGVNHYSFDDIGYTFLSHESSQTFSGNLKQNIKIYCEHLDMFEKYLAKHPLTEEQKRLFKKHHRKDSIRLALAAIKSKNAELFFSAAKRGIAVSHAVWIFKFVTTPPMLAIRKGLRIIRSTVTEKHRGDCPNSSVEI